MAETKKNTKTDTIGNTILTTVSYKFFYKDKFGRMNSEIVEVSKKDSELAIATFEHKYPEIIWRSFVSL